MKRSRAKSNGAAWLACCLFGASPAWAAIELRKDWADQDYVNGVYVPHDDREGWRMKAAAKAYARSLNAQQDRENGGNADATFSGGFILMMDGTKYYVMQTMFMARVRPGEVCTPDWDKGLSYRCQEGQTLAKSCHLLFLNDRFEPAGVYRIKVAEAFTPYCNSVPALGVGDKSRNELLTTVQYFNADRPRLAQSATEIGSSWRRMTVLLRLKAVNGQIEVEQDDTCLKNPNQIDTIPEARKKIRQCAAAAVSGK